MPSADYWAKSEAVSCGFSWAVRPPTVGVATLDALDAHGQLYAGAGAAQFHADTLEGRPLNLAGGTDTYLSFRFQPGGWAEMAPAPGDSLLVDFYQPDLAEWRTVWRASLASTRRSVSQHLRSAGGDFEESVTDAPSAFSQFFRAMIPVAANYCADGFRFRFRNLASIPAGRGIRGIGISIRCISTRTVLRRTLRLKMWPAPRCPRFPLRSIVPFPHQHLPSS